jgi:hypothetical protein
MTIESRWTALHLALYGDEQLHDGRVLAPLLLLRAAPGAEQREANLERAVERAVKRAVKSR